MARNRKEDDTIADTDVPALSTQDWDEVAGAGAEPDAGFENGDFRYGEDAKSPEEDDDNPDQDSDEALPDDDEEKALDGYNRRAGLRDQEA